MQHGLEEIANETIKEKNREIRLTKGKNTALEFALHDLEQKAKNDVINLADEYNAEVKNLEEENAGLKKALQVKNLYGDPPV